MTEQLINQCKLYNQLLPSFVLMAASQKYCHTWQSLPNLKEQALASNLSETKYIQAVSSWADIPSQHENYLVQCLLSLPSIEKQSFNALYPTSAFFDSNPPSYLRRVSLVEPSGSKPNPWHTSIPTPFGYCHTEGYQNTVTLTSYLDSYPSNTPSPASHIFNLKDSPTIQIENQGTPFDKKIREKLLDLPYGNSASYGQLGPPRAVGGAMRRNPYIFIVPCHKVLGHNFSLGGYSGGNKPENLARKVAIILWERLQLYKQEER
jgi:O-6-methylguanine DNA methyltransferase